MNTALTVNGESVIPARVNGAISIVAPPDVTGVAPDLGPIAGGDALAIASSMNVGGHLVDVSPLSTLGALCMAAAAAGTDMRKMFNQLMAWGLAMTVVGGLTCYLMFGLGG